MSDDSLSDEDKALFRAQMHRVKPLHGAGEKVTKTRKPQVRPPNIAARTPPKPPESYPLSDYIQESVLSETVLSYCVKDFSLARLKDLKRGLIPWEARLDLHGLRKEEARVALCDFIQRQVQDNKRCLLIVHGKGGKAGEAPIIKNHLHRWLPQLDMVQAYHSALPKDGGVGAVYVLLKKNKTPSL
jgi:DNA-nicking Smr family endonuclease